MKFTNVLLFLSFEITKTLSICSSEYYLLFIAQTSFISMYVLFEMHWVMITFVRISKKLLFFLLVAAVSVLFDCRELFYFMKYKIL